MLLGIVADRYWNENAHKGHYKEITSFSYEINLDFPLILKRNKFSISFSLSIKISLQKVGPLTDIQYFDLLN